MSISFSRSLDESFQCEAPDYAVARFIKHSSEHKRKLDDAMKAVADVTAVENGRYVGYRCQPVYVSTSRRCPAGPPVNNVEIKNISSTGFTHRALV